MTTLASDSPSAKGGSAYAFCEPSSNWVWLTSQYRQEGSMGRFQRDTRPASYPGDASQRARATNAGKNKAGIRPLDRSVGTDSSRSIIWKLDCEC
jgi:hypothetical protein